MDFRQEPQHFGIIVQLLALGIRFVHPNLHAFIAPGFWGHSKVEDFIGQLKPPEVFPLWPQAPFSPRPLGERVAGRPGERKVNACAGSFVKRGRGANPRSPSNLSCRQSLGTSIWLPLTSDSPTYKRKASASSGVFFRNFNCPFGSSNGFERVAGFRASRDQRRGGSKR
jgi:hypothetical protein